MEQEIYYHGSESKFDNFEFTDNKTYQEFDIPSWFFTEDKEYAKSYGKYLYYVKLNIANTFDTSIPKHYKMLIKSMRGYGMSKSEIENVLDEQFSGELPYWTCGDAFYAAKDNNFDSILIQEELEGSIESIAVFNKENIEIVDVEESEIIKELRKIIREALDDSVRYDTVLIRLPHMDKNTSIQLSTKNEELYQKAKGLFYALKQQFPNLKLFLQSDTGRFIMIESWSKDDDLFMEAAQWFAGELGLPLDFDKQLNEISSESEYIYHGTHDGAVHRMQRDGRMRLNAANNNEPYISFTSDPRVAEYYANAKGGPSKGIVLRTIKTGDFSLSPKFEKNQGFEWITTREIPVEELEIRLKDSNWSPLMKWDVIDKKVINESVVPHPTLKSILDSEEAYAILDKYIGGTWTEGGCAILAAALSKYYDFPIWVIFNPQKGTAEHFVVQVGRYKYLDYDGIHTNMLKDFVESELIDDPPKLKPYSKGVPTSDIIINNAAANELYELFKEKGL